MKDMENYLCEREQERTLQTRMYENQAYILEQFKQKHSLASEEQSKPANDRRAR
jgi:hypothetical protein